MRSKIKLGLACALFIIGTMRMVQASTLFSITNASEAAQLSDTTTVNMGHDEIYTRPILINPSGNDFSLYFANATSAEECICIARNLDETELYHSASPVCENMSGFARKKCINNRMWQIQHFDKVLKLEPHPNYNDLQLSYAKCIVKTTGSYPGRDWTPHIRLNVDNPTWDNPTASMFREDAADLFCPLPAKPHACPIDNCNTGDDCHKWYDMYVNLSQAQRNAFYTVCLSKLPHGE